MAKIQILWYSALNIFIISVIWGCVIMAADSQNIPVTQQQGRQSHDPSDPLVDLRSTSENGGVGNCQKDKYVVPFKLPTHYNKFEFPTARNENCSFENMPIRVGIRIRNIRGIVDLNEEISMELDLISTWRDYILADVLFNKTEAEFDKERGTEYIALESSFINEIWQPDIIFSKAISITKPAVHTSRINYKPSRLRIYPRGWVELYSRLLVTLYCPMDFSYFPADTQTCNVRLRSYSFTNDDVELSWQMVPKSVGSLEEKELVFLYGRSHPNYRIHLHDILTTHNIEFDAENKEENYTYLGFSLSVKRKLTYHITQTFIPTVFLVIITWLTFFIPLSNLEARIAVAMTTLLTMTNKFAEVGRYTPNVSYINAIDIYMFTCISIVFLTLFEFTFLYYLRMGRAEQAESRVSLKKKIVPKGREQFELEDGNKTSYIDDRVYLQVRHYVEVYGFLVTIIGFILFNFVFWPWMLFSSGYYNNEVDLDYNSAEA